MEGKWHSVKTTTCDRISEGEKWGVDGVCCPWWKKNPNRKNASTQVWIGNHGIISKIRLQRLKDSENLTWYRRLLRIPATKTEWLVRKDLEIRASLLSDQLSWLVWDSQNSAPRTTSQTWENRDGRLPYGYIILSQDQTFFWVRGGLF